jgi:putative hydrolase of the HAD superfamily
MFETALTELGIAPHEALFIDDSLKNVKGAIALGIPSTLMVREERDNQVNPKYERIHNLHELVERLHGYEKVIGSGGR